MTDAVRSRWPARSSRLVVYAVLLILSMGCFGKGISPAEAPVERAGGGPVSRQPAHEPPARDEASFLVYLEEQLNRGQFDALRSAKHERAVCGTDFSQRYLC